MWLENELDSEKVVSEQTIQKQVGREPNRN